MKVASFGKKSPIGTKLIDTVWDLLYVHMGSYTKVKGHRSLIGTKLGLSIYLNVGQRSQINVKGYVLSICIICIFVEN